MFHIAVEGSIGSGKSCFLTRLKEVFAKMVNQTLIVILSCWKSGKS